MRLYCVRFLLNHATMDNLQSDHFAWAKSPESAVRLASMDETALEVEGDTEVAEVAALPGSPPAEERAISLGWARFLVCAEVDGVSITPL